MSVKFFMALFGSDLVAGFKAKQRGQALWLLATNFATTVRRFMSASHAQPHSPQVGGSVK